MSSFLFFLLILATATVAPRRSIGLEGLKDHSPTSATSPTPSDDFLDPETKPLSNLDPRSWRSVLDQSTSDSSPASDPTEVRHTSGLWGLILGDLDEVDATVGEMEAANLKGFARVTTTRERQRRGGVRVRSKKIFGSQGRAMLRGRPFLFAATGSFNGSHPSAPTSPLVTFLQRLQSAALQSLGPESFDPKLYLDLSLKHDLDSTVAAFDSLPRTGRDGAIAVRDFRQFLDGYFISAGDDLVRFVPEDFVEEPEGFLPKVEHPEVRAWALEVHALWRNLSRRVSDGVMERPERHTLLPLPRNFLVPGSRFREMYYWDSYWIVRGLLASKMYDTAKAVVNNLIYLIDAYGFVLNGARTYYSNRSQPPLLSSMVLDIYKWTGDLMFVEKALPSLLKEHGFWNSGIHKVIIQDSHGSKHSMYRYYAMWNKPRPESATIDEESASKLNDSEKEKFFRELASTAESGWDFSSRWMTNSSDLTSLSTTIILPVDLNAFMLKMEHDIAFMANLVGKSSIAEEFLKASRLRLSSFQSIFWNTQMDQWLDYWFVEDNYEGFYKWNAHHQNKNVFASNFMPIWIDVCNSDESKMSRIVESLRSSGLVCKFGIATSLSNTGQQWDFPNGWAPLQHMIVEGLFKSGYEEAKLLAEEIFIKWIRTNYVAFKKTRFMHEKYDVESCGMIGGGGEYIPQTGFGWSNGVVLALLEEFGWPRDREINC